MTNYYEQKDLEDFPNIGEYAPAAGEEFFDYYGAAMMAGITLAYSTQMRKILKKKEM